MNKKIRNLSQILADDIVTIIEASTPDTSDEAHDAINKKLSAYRDDLQDAIKID